MSFPVFNSVQDPTSTLLIKWSSKRKAGIIDEKTFEAALPTEFCKVIAFAAKQGKAIVEFTTVDQANSFLQQCQKECICLENGLKLHSNYCKLVKPHSKEDVIPEMKNVELPDVTVISSSDDHPYPFHFCKDKEKMDDLLYSFNQYLLSSYDTIQIFDIDPSSPFSLFLEHHCFGDRFAFTVVCEENQSWDVIIPHANGLNKYHCLQDCFCIEGKTRFCQNILISSQTKGSILVVCNKRNTPCNCNYPDFCYQRLLESSTNCKPTQMENEHVYQVYDKIANHFSSTRYSQWKGVIDFLDSLPNYSLVMDMGCGNGKYLTYSHETRSLYFVGCDRSIELLRICQEHDKEVSLMDGVFLAYREESFDSVISIAVIHHLSTNALRRRFLANMIQVLKKGGHGLVVAWALEKDTSGLNTKSNRGYSNADGMVQWQLQNKYSQEKNEVYERYYHMFHQGELEWLLSTFENIQIVKSWYERENWFVHFMKLLCVCLNNVRCYGIFLFE